MPRSPLGRGAALGRSTAAALAAALLAATCSTGAGVAGTSVAPATSTAATTTSTVPPTSTTTTSTTTTSTTTTTLAVTTTTLPAWWRAASAEEPLRVWVIGDSLAGPVGNALARLTAGWEVVTIILDFQSGTGLASPSYFDWPGFVEGRMGEVAPDVVVVVLGANDAQALMGREGWVEYGTEEWDAEYAALVGGFMDRLAADARRVYWVGMPKMAGPEYDGRMRHLNRILLTQAGLRLEVRFVEAYTLFQDQAGQYAAVLPDESGQWVLMRAEDGIHYTSAGAERVARRVLEVLDADWRLSGLSGE